MSQTHDSFNQQHFVCTKETPHSSYSVFNNHNSVNVDKDANIDPPNHPYSCIGFASFAKP